MKYAMESRWSGKIGFQTASPLETFGLFAGWQAGLPKSLFQGNRKNGWRLVEKTHGSSVWKKFKLTKKLQHIEISLSNKGKAVFDPPLTMQEVTQ